MEAKFLTALKKQDIDDKNFFLLAPLVYRSAVLGGTITVPERFVSDGSSTPRVPIVYFFYGDRAHHEGVPHDYIYRVKDHKVDITHEDGSVESKVISKEDADSLFKEAMISRGKPSFIVWGMYLGVKFGGQSSYDSGYQRFKILTPEEAAAVPL